MIVHQISRPRPLVCGWNNFYVPLVTKTTYMMTYGAGKCGGMQRTWEAKGNDELKAWGGDVAHGSDNHLDPKRI